MAFNPINAMIRISIKVYTDGTYMNVEYSTRRKEANDRETRVASLIRATVRERIEQAMLEHKNGIILSGPKKKLNKQILQKYKNDRNKQRDRE